ncbi:MAG: site-2 protease family protein [Patescibacteria group bacterium]
MQGFSLIFDLLIVLVSVIVHEVSHGYMAAYLGDPTAKLSGRLTLNPLSHLDPFGSILLPGMLYFIGAPMIGYAKPVPYNPYNLRGGKWGPALVAMAGPGTNFLIALIFGLLLRFAPVDLATVSVLSSIVLINIVLGVFNSIPVAPLDGSKVLFALLPYRYYWVEEWAERYSLVLVLLFIILGWPLVEWIVPLVFRLIVGV